LTVDRLAVIGNCQAAPLANCLRRANPKLQVSVMLAAGRKDPDHRKQVMEKLCSADIILVQPGGGGRLGSARLAAKFKNVVLYPRMTFYGFHPDFFYMRSASGKLIRSACGLYHSKIVAAAFSMGLSENRATKLFNAFIFARLGYFGKFAPWKRIFLERAAAIGYDLADDFEAWLKSGAFMHTLNHPSVRVLASVASRIMRKSGIEQVNSVIGAYDPLARATQLPVYPEIASAIGIEPIRCFRVSSRDKRGVRDLLVRDFVAESFRIYSGLDPIVFETDEIRVAREILRGDVLC
jgi:hypothetical protein